MHGFADEPFAVANKDVQGGEDVLYLFFTTSDASVTRAGSSYSGSSPAPTVETRP
jgi:hypothetical protein